MLIFRSLDCRLGERRGVQLLLLAFKAFTSQFVIWLTKSRIKLLLLDRPHFLDLVSLNWIEKKGNVFLFKNTDRETGHIYSVACVVWFKKVLFQLQPWKEKKSQASVKILFSHSLCFLLSSQHFLYLLYFSLQYNGPV